MPSITFLVAQSILNSGIFYSSKIYFKLAFWWQHETSIFFKSKLNEPKKYLQICIGKNTINYNRLLLLMRPKYSALVCLSDSNVPNKVLVTVLLPAFSTPLITMHM